MTHTTSVSDWTALVVVTAYILVAFAAGLRSAGVTFKREGR